MLWRVLATDPGIIFHAPAAFARDPVGVGAAQAGILDRFMAVDADMIFGGGLHDAQIMVHHPLAFMPFAMLGAVGIDPLDLAGIGDIAGLHHLLAMVGRPFEGTVELAVIMAGRSAGFMMADQGDALGFRIGGKAVGVEILGRLREVHCIAVAEPVAVPADIPALDQHGGDAAGSGEIDVAADIGGGGAMFGAARPAPFALDHVPPDADELARLDPRNIAQLVRLVQVQDHVVHVEAGGIVGDGDGAPGGGEAGVARHLGRACPRRQIGAESVALGTGEIHARIIDQRGLMQGDMSAVGQLHRHHGLGSADRVERGAVVEIFLAVPFIGGLPPGGAALREGELGQLLGNVGVMEIGLVGQAVAEGDAIIEQAEGHIHLALEIALLAEDQLQLIMMVADRDPFTPGLGPAGVAARLLAVGERQVALDLGRVGEHEAQTGIGDQRLAIALHGVAGAPLAIEADGEGDMAVGRGGPGHHIGARGGGRERQGNERKSERGQSRHGNVLKLGRRRRGRMRGRNSSRRCGRSTVRPASGPHRPGARRRDWCRG